MGLGTQQCSWHFLPLPVLQKSSAIGTSLPEGHSSGRLSPWGYHHATKHLIKLLHFNYKDRNYIFRRQNCFCLGLILISPKLISEFIHFTMKVQKIPIFKVQGKLNRLLLYLPTASNESAIPKLYTSLWQRKEERPSPFWTEKVLMYWGTRIHLWFFLVTTQNQNALSMAYFHRTSVTFSKWVQIFPLLFLSRFGSFWLMWSYRNSSVYSSWLIPKDLGFKQPLINSKGTFCYYW